MPSHLRGCYITAAKEPTAGPSHTADQLKTWITVAGGHYEATKFTDRTTHLIVTERIWRKQTGLVKQALEAIRYEERDVHILSWDWLDDCLREKKRKRIGDYLWQKLDPIPGVSVKAKGKQKEATDGDKSQSIRAATIEIYQNEVGKFMTDEQRAKAEKKIEEQQRKAREEEEANKQRQAELDRLRREQLQKKSEVKMTHQEHAAVFRKGAKKARNELLSDNHHVYKDETGFNYDIFLTKVDARNNCNERIVLTIYESNAVPNTYAMNAQFAATNRRPENNIISAIGSRFEAALRAFKEHFKNKTGWEWDHRITNAEARLQRMKDERQRRQEFGSETGSMGLGRGRMAPGTGGFSMQKSNEEIRLEKEANEKRFRDTLFLYHPPTTGPCGVLPGSSMEHVQRSATPLSTPHSRVEAWRSDARTVSAATPPTSVTPRSTTPPITQNDEPESGMWDGHGDLIDNITLDTSFPFDDESNGQDAKQSAVGVDVGKTSSTSDGIKAESSELGSIVPSVEPQTESCPPNSSTHSPHATPSVPVEHAPDESSPPGATQAAKRTGEECMAALSEENSAEPAHTPASLDSHTCVSVLGKRKERSNDDDEPEYQVVAGQAELNKTPRIMEDETQKSHDLLAGVAMPSAAIESGKTAEGKVLNAEAIKSDDGDKASTVV